MINLMQGDCLEKMKDLPDNSVDAIIADPPYGLGKEPDAHEMLMAWVEQGHYDHKAKRGFMGKEWDSFVPQPAVWKECFRVLKPGGHLLSFFGTRTYDIGTLAVRLAGFEIRDQINWVFGSGFPKSLNVSKQILKNKNNIDKAIDNIDKNDILSIWKKYSNNVLSVEIQSKKNPIEVGFNITKNDFVQKNAVVNHKIKKEILNVIIAEIGFLDPNHTLELVNNIVLKNVEMNIKQKKFNVKYVPKYLQDQSLLLGTMFIAQKNVLAYLNENLMNKIKEEEAQKILSGELSLLKMEIINVVCAVQMNELKHTILNRSKIFQNLDMMLQMDYVYATNVTITKSIMECLITNTENILNLPNTDQAKKWDGWGTALKPAHESIVLARKPLSEKTIAKNVLKHGVGGINIGSCRVGTDPITNVKKSYLGGTGQFVDNTTKIKYTNIETNVGRFPANIIHDGSDEVLEVFPNTKSGSGNFKKLSSKEKDGNKGPAYGAESRPVGSEMVSYGDKGSASRYFYCAKTSKSDRHCTTDNNHPTVKPTALMEYLCKLITPSGGVILDPFMGSGSTGKAAVNLDFDFIGIELDPDYFKIAEKRIYAKNLDNEM